MYRVIKKIECKNCRLMIDQYCTWGMAKKKKRIIGPRGKKNKHCKLISRKGR